MKPVVILSGVMILAASVGGCLTGAEYFGRPADAPPPAVPSEPERPAIPAVKYDASWYRTEDWAGEYPDGFTVDRDTTISIRATADLGAPKAKSCALRKGAAYHPWNKKRVAADHLKFITFTRIETYELKEDYVWPPIHFKKGDRWSLLAGLSEGDFLMRFGGKTYEASQDLLEKSDKVGGKRRDPVHDDVKAVEAEELASNHQWVRLTCANGGAGWVFYNEIIKTRGFSKSGEACGYGCTEDRKPGDEPPPE